MPDEAGARRVRGPGKKPRHALTSIRIPVYVLEYFKQSFDNSSTKMREVLEQYAITNGAKHDEDDSTRLPSQVPQRQRERSGASDRSESGLSLRGEIQAKKRYCRWCGLYIPPEAAWSPTEGEAD